MQMSDENDYVSAKASPDGISVNTVSFKAPAKYQTTKKVKTMKVDLSVADFEDGHGATNIFDDEDESIKNMPSGSGRRAKNRGTPQRSKAFVNSFHSSRSSRTADVVFPSQPDSNQEQPVFSDMSEDEFDDQAAKIFENIFSERFISAEKNGQVDKNGVFIKKQEYAEAVKKVTKEDEQIKHFMQLYDIADRLQIGKIHKSEILRAIASDLKVQLAESQISGSFVSVTNHQRNATLGQKCIDEFKNSPEAENKKYSSFQGFRNNSYVVRNREFNLNNSVVSLDKSFEVNEFKRTSTMINKEKSRDLGRKLLRTQTVEEYGLDLKNFQSAPKDNQSYSDLRRNTIKSIRQIRDKSRQDTMSNISNNKDNILDDLEEDKFIQQQSKHIFEIIFAPFFNMKDRENRANGLKIEPVLTFDEFEQAIQDHAQNNPNQSILVKQFQKADKAQCGAITKKQLLKAIEDDIIYGQEIGLDDEVYGNNITANQSSTFYIGSTQMNENPMDDPILNMLQQNFNSPHKNGLHKCNDLVQAIDYIEKSKLEDYHLSKEKLKILFSMLSQTVTNISLDYESLLTAAQEKEVYHDVNKEMEAQLEQVTCEINELQVYERAYFEQKRKFDTINERNHELEIERNNLLTVNQDLLNEYDNLKHQMMLEQVKREEDKIMTEQLKFQMKNLKGQIVSKYHEKKDDEFIAQLEEESFGEDPYQMEEVGKIGKSSIKQIIIDSQSEESDEAFEMSMKNQSPERRANRAKRLSIDKKSISSPDRNLSRCGDSMNTLLISLQAIGDQDISMSKSAADLDCTNVEEQKILEHLDTTGVFNLRDDIRNFILNNVQLERKGLNMKIQEMEKTHTQFRNVLHQQKIKIQELKSIIKSQEKISQQKDQDYKNIADEYRKLRQTMQQATEETQRLNDEKNRLLGVNNILEHQIQVEKSEKMTVLSEAQNINRYYQMKKSSVNSHNLSISHKMGGRMSNYIRKQNLAMSSMRSKELSSSIVGQEGLYLKHQTRKMGDHVSDFKGRSPTGKSSMNLSYAHVIVNDDQSSMKRSFKSSIRRVTDQQSLISGRDSKGGRVQVISDFQSDDDEGSIENLNVEEINDLNLNIETFQNNQLLERRKSNIYDQIGLTQEGHKFHQSFLKLVNQNRKQPFVFGSCKVYANYANIYQNKILNEILLVMLEGQVYIVKTKEMQLEVDVFNFLTDINKVVYSEKYEQMMAIKLRDLKKFQNRDHVVLEVKERKLLADFLLEYADLQKDEIIFEQNEEFKMLVNLYPIWFSFEDVERSKKEQALLFKNSKYELKGFVEVKEVGAINLFKSIWKGDKAIWEDKYFVLKGVKIYIYQGKSDQVGGVAQNQFTKPQKVITLTHDLSITEIRKADIGGKENVFELIQPNDAKGVQKLTISAPTYDSYNNWLKTITKIKKELEQLKQETHEFQIKVLKSPTRNERSADDSFNLSQHFGIKNLHLLDGQLEKKIKLEICNEESPRKEVNQTPSNQRKMTLAQSSSRRSSNREFVQSVRSGQSKRSFSMGKKLENESDGPGRKVQKIQLSSGSEQEYSD